MQHREKTNSKTKGKNQTEAGSKIMEEALTIEINNALTEPKRKTKMFFPSVNPIEIRKL